MSRLILLAVCSRIESDTLWIYCGDFGSSNIRTSRFSNSFTVICFHGSLGGYEMNVKFALRAANEAKGVWVNVCGVRVCSLGTPIGSPVSLSLSLFPLHKQRVYPGLE
jgi:hypothetical protein